MTVLGRPHAEQAPLVKSTCAPSVSRAHKRCLHLSEHVGRNPNVPQVKPPGGGAESRVRPHHAQHGSVGGAWSGSIRLPPVGGGQTCAPQERSRLPNGNWTATCRRSTIYLPASLGTALAP